MKYTIKDILRLEVAPALGCTEPSAVALCAAAASTLLKDKRSISSIEISLNPNLYKNGMAVSIPGADGSSGIELAAALGALGGDPSLKLEVLEPVKKSVVNKAKSFVENNQVKVKVLKNRKRLYIHVKIFSGNDIAEAKIHVLHDAITSISFNGKEKKNHPLLSKSEKNHLEVERLEKWISGLTLAQLVVLAEAIDVEDMDFIEQGVAYNVKLAEYGVKKAAGLGIASAYEKLIEEGLLARDIMLSAKILTSAASDARMSGAKLPAMSSAGSGNHGLTAILPIKAVFEFLEYDSKEKFLKSIALSHVITAYVKSFTGRLSAVCGCSIAAGAGAAGGITYLMGGKIPHIASAIKNLVSDLAGVICDGAKESCSFKLATAAGTAVQSALFALHGIDVKATDGIIALSPEQTMKNVGELSMKGMIEADRTILQIMIDKKLGFEEG